jgi:hypothetical protein
MVGQLAIHVADNSKDALVKLPLIYLMDCTLNDCSLILKSMDQVCLWDPHLISIYFSCIFNILYK